MLQSGKAGRALTPAKSNKSSNGKSNGKNQLQAVSAAYSRNISTGAPQISRSGYGSDARIRIRHREYIQDINGSVAYANNSFSINPGLSSTFPWLSNIAQNYESYIFRDLQFCFETEKSSATNGTILMGIDFDSADSAPSNKTQLMSFHNAVRSAVWAECCYKADSQDLLKFGVQRYMRYGTLASNLDIKTYDVGKLYVATQGEADTTAIGELYVIYDVEFMTPQLDPSGITTANSALVVGSGSVSRAAPLGTAPTITGGLPCSGASATITFNKVGEYMVSYGLAGTVFTDTLPTLTGTVTSTTLVGVQGHNTANTVAIGLCKVKVNNVGETLIFDFTASATTITSSSFYISSYDYDL